MADESMDQILEQARRLGELIREHPRYQRLRDADEKVRQDTDATKALEAYNQAASDLQEKEQKGQAIEVDEKRNLDQLRDQVVASDTVKAFSQAQADYADLMRQMNEAIFEAIAASDQQGPASAGGEKPSGGPSIITPE